MWARIHLIPALQAEEDRDQVRRYLADQAREKELLGTETRVYNSDRQVAWTDYECVLTMLLQIRQTYVRYYTGKTVEVEGLGDEHGCGDVYIEGRSYEVARGSYSKKSYPFLGQIYERCAEHARRLREYSGKKLSSLQLH